MGQIKMQKGSFLQNNTKVHANSFCNNLAKQHTVAKIISEFLHFTVFGMESWKISQ